MRQEQRGLDRRGATAVFVAVSLAALLGMVALAVDVGMLMKVRADAQRAADAAALAGAQEFMTATPAAARIPAGDSALRYAARNYVGWRYVDTTGAIYADSGNNRIINSPEAFVKVIPDSQKVRVIVRRANTATWFGHMLGIDFVPISVKAAAWVTNSGTAKCVKPIALPDLWYESSKGPGGEDANSNRAWDVGEQWRYQPTPAGDYYAQFDPNGNNVAQQTGYGSAWRNGTTGFTNDYGLQLSLDGQAPGGGTNLLPSFWMLWRMPLSAGGTAKGANDYRSLITDTTCTVAGPASLGVDYRIEDGVKNGPGFQAWGTLFDYDPLAYWDPNYPDGQGHMGAVRNSKYQDWHNSPRVFVVGIFDPKYINNLTRKSGGNLNIQFNNLAVFFLDNKPKKAQDPIVGRFLYFVKSTGPTGPVAGSLIKKLQLVE